MGANWFSLFIYSYRYRFGSGREYRLLKLTYCYVLTIVRIVFLTKGRKNNNSNKRRLRKCVTFSKRRTERACVASVSVRFQNKARNLKKGFPLLTVQKMEREPKNEKGGGRGEVSFLSLTHPPFLLGRYFARLFFAPKAHGNACYAATQAI